MPIDETIQICLDALYRTPDVVTPAIPEDLLKKLLVKSTRGVEFSFNNIMFRQIDGVAMGSPLGPILANIFLGYCESQIPENEWPEMYHRYVDDTFSLFANGKESALKFLERLRNLHTAIEFTMEGEADNRLPFLDVLVIRKDARYETTICRKPTFTGLYTRWDSYCDPGQKIALIRSLTNRAKRICSPQLLTDEIAQLKRIFHQNGYPPPIVDQVIQRTLRQKERAPTVKRKPVYLRLPWLGDVSASFKSRVRQATAKVAPWCEPVIYFTSRKMLNTSNKDVLPTDHKSNVIYLFSCKCGSSYVGRTSQRLGDRVRQHVPAALMETDDSKAKKKRATTSKKDPSDIKSADSGITRHLKSSRACLQAVWPNLLDQFTILAKARTSSHLAVLEALHIAAMKPDLCAQKDFVRSLVLFR